MASKATAEREMCTARVTVTREMVRVMVSRVILERATPMAKGREKASKAIPLARAICMEARLMVEAIPMAATLARTIIKGRAMILAAKVMTLVAKAVKATASQ